MAMACPSSPLPLLLPLRSCPKPLFSPSFASALARRRLRVLRAGNSAVASTTVAAAAAGDDEVAKCGRKQVISLTPELYRYLLSNVREHPVSPDQAQLLAMLVQITGAQRCIEVGVYTGYSSLAVALVLPESGRLVACERDEKCLGIARKYYEHAGVSRKVVIKQALAADTLRSLISNGEACSYDFAFVDAEKRMYDEYFELLLQLVRVGGLIVIDNVLWHGKVADPQVKDSKTVSLRNFNKKLLADKRVNISMVPIGDGMTICRKMTDS
ncbi:uncharacterized protein LOC109728727 isoform X2 [Ananas comosus]|uniref:Uncharacterized protein LOC109728727 isoform X2 n=1 Tax=Ananas comosus TaxID=4615 RepID=A0A6P5H5L8_ANACO|nr:uncharacterized protein LOC109728727 isoform X2 [Ananas comosus]